jgi:hypothetical protein
MKWRTKEFNEEQYEAATQGEYLFEISIFGILPRKKFMLAVFRGGTSQVGRIYRQFGDNQEKLKATAEQIAAALKGNQS